MAAADDLERLYDEHAPALFSFLLNFTRNEADTHDLLQELFLKLAQRPGLLAEARDQRAFLLRLAHNLAIDLFRRRGTDAKQCAQLAAEPAPLFAPASDPDERAFREALAAALACALERYRLAHGQFPDVLDALAPQFMEKVPRDIINGQALKYRRTQDGQFVLYSVGWNETDDGGTVGSSRETGDWVWR